MDASLWIIIALVFVGVGVGTVRRLSACSKHLSTRSGYVQPVPPQSAGGAPCPLKPRKTGVPR